MKKIKQLRIDLKKINRIFLWNKLTKKNKNNNKKIN